MYLTDSSVTCDAGSEELVHLVTELGGVHVDRSTFINCALDATSTLSPILLDDVRAYATVGNPVQMRLSTLRGMIEVKNSVVDTMDLTSPRGGVRVESVNASASVLIAAGGLVARGLVARRLACVPRTDGAACADQGFVRVRSLRVGGNVQIETTTGAVELHIAVRRCRATLAPAHVCTAAARGLQRHHLHQHGRRRDGGGGCCDVQCAALACCPCHAGARSLALSRALQAQQRSGRINCNAQCAYYGGEILITSSTGRVHVRAD